MAIYGIEDEFYKCKKCGSIFFEEVEIKTYNTNNIQICENTSTKSIKCIKCGNYQDVDGDYFLIGQA